MWENLPVRARRESVCNWHQKRRNSWPFLSGGLGYRKIFLWESRCEDRVLPDPFLGAGSCHLSAIRSVSLPLFRERRGYNSIPITLVGTVLHLFLVLQVSGSLFLGVYGYGILLICGWCSKFVPSGSPIVGYLALGTAAKALRCCDAEDCWSWRMLGKGGTRMIGIAVSTISPARTIWKCNTHWMYVCRGSLNYLKKSRRDFVLSCVLRSPASRRTRASNIFHIVCLYLPCLFRHHKPDFLPNAPTPTMAPPPKSCT